MDTPSPIAFLSQGPADHSCLLPFNPGVLFLTLMASPAPQLPLTLQTPRGNCFIRFLFRASALDQIHSLATPSSSSASPYILGKHQHPDKLCCMLLTRTQAGPRHPQTGVHTPFSTPLKLLLNLFPLLEPQASYPFLTLTYTVLLSSFTETVEAVSREPRSPTSRAVLPRGTLLSPQMNFLFSMEASLSDWDSSQRRLSK